MSDSGVPEGEVATQLGDQRLSARFCIKKSLGVGGMGEVYLAEDSKLRRLVAIKSVRPDLCKNPEVRKRIERECLLHAKVGPHPHIVTLFDKLEDGDRINLVMEYVEGETLQDLLERHHQQGTVPPLPEALAIASQCLEALSRIHAQGIVHRDIKPSNIILYRDEAGEICAKMMDFGIARAQDDEFASKLTQEHGSGPGTPLYMAPEQIDPQTFGDISAATDVYSMGVLIYQMTSGEPPFSGTLTQIFSGHLHGTPPPLRERARGRVPDSLVEIVHCALEKQADRRFPSAKAFREELLHASVDVPRGACSTAATATLRKADDPSRTMVASEIRAGSPGSTVLGGAVAGPGHTMLAGTAETGAEVRRKRKLFRVAAAAVAFVLVAGGGAMAYKKMGGEEPASAKAESTEPAAGSTAGQPAPPATNPSAPSAVTATATPPVPDSSVTPPASDPAAAAAVADTLPSPVQPETQPAVAIVPNVAPPQPPAPAMDTSPTPPPQSTNAASDAFEAAWKSKAQEPAPAVPDTTPASVTPDAPVVAEPPASTSSAPKTTKPKTTKKPASATNYANTSKPKSEPKPTAPAPANDKPKSGGWNVIGERSSKVE